MHKHNEVFTGESRREEHKRAGSKILGGDNPFSFSTYLPHGHTTEHTQRILSSRCSWQIRSKK